MKEELLKRIKSKRKILFNTEDECFDEFKKIIGIKSHKTLILWAFDLIAIDAKELSEKYDDDRPLRALYGSKLWAKGEVKMKTAKKDILDCHAMAKELTDKKDAAKCHAIGQACAIVHTKEHVMGYVIYDLTSIIRSSEIDRVEELIKGEQIIILIGYYFQKKKVATSLGQSSSSDLFLLLNDKRYSLIICHIYYIYKQYIY